MDAVARPAVAAWCLLLGLAVAQGAAGDDRIVDQEGAQTGAHARPRTASTALPRDHSGLEPHENHSGGAGTSFHAPTRNAFSHPAQNLAPAQRTRFRVGDAVFRKLWVTAPASTAASDGLGPLFNARSCQRCHRKDGRGRPPLNESDRGGTLLLALTHPNGADPVYGGQLQPHAVPGVPSEGRIEIAHRPVSLPGLPDTTLRHPLYEVRDLSWGPLDPQTGLSPRVAPPMIGLGLLEAIAEADILAHADPDDVDGDGISGRASWVPAGAPGRRLLGRFGWKAEAPTIRGQAAKAFFEDIGIGNPALPGAAGACTPAQVACQEAPGGDGDGDGIEISARLFDQVVFYARNLAVPARRDADAPEVLDGKRIFHAAGCADCHVPKFVTPEIAGRPEHSFQLVWPYTDLLLHDMGDELADGGTDPLRREWRTPPLWGIGLTETVSGTFRLLHDGRADGLLEAILWHGGEAEAARDRVMQLSRAEREHLLAFLRSL